jgi:hypothetical protein
LAGVHLFDLAMARGNYRAVLGLPTGLGTTATLLTLAFGFDSFFGLLNGSAYPEWLRGQAR